MTGLKTLLESIVSEKAMSISDVGGLALLIHKTDEKTEFILFDPSLYLEYHKKQSLYDIEWNSSRLVDSIVGYIRVEDARPRGGNWGAKEVMLSAAKKKYGPMMYDIAMSLSKGIIPDRSVPSPSAKAVWKHYFNNRPDVVAKPLDDLTRPKTKTTKDDGYVVFDDNDADKYLDYAYFSTGPKVNVKQLVANAKKSMKQAQTIFKKRIREEDPDEAKNWSDEKISKMFLTKLENAAARYFNVKY